VADKTQLGSTCHKRDLHGAVYGARTTVLISRDAGVTKSVVVVQSPGNTRSVYNNLLEVEKEPPPPYQRPYLPRPRCRRSDITSSCTFTRERDRSIETQHAREKPTNCKYDSSFFFQFLGEGVGRRKEMFPFELKYTYSSFNTLTNCFC